AGSMGNELSEKVKANSTVYNEIGDSNKMQELFREAHAIILTSAFEGFPLVIKEGMSNGCVPIVTALPGNKVHLQHFQNALLIENPEDEKGVVKQAIDNILYLLANPLHLQDLSGNAFNYAKTHFTKDLFIRRYRELLK
ncbi:MAG: glycosyltransferase family 4 protein, partial [Chitinophagaceae bacterium]|nr:glycosyltransferase family 4 protein [Chitinophagaceae bacterium]